MTAARAGSYDPRRTTGDGLAAELVRLEAQAELSFVEEARLLDELGLFAEGSVLEVGAGSGAMTRRIRSSRPAVQLTALDIDPDLLSHAGGCGAELVEGDAHALPFADGSFGGVLLRYVLQHAGDPARVIAEAVRVTRPGGIVATIEVDNGAWGIAEPYYPELARIHAAVAAAQSAQGGNRAVGRRMTGYLRRAGCGSVTMRAFSTTSDDHPMESFAPHLGPQRLMPLVAAGHLDLSDLALATDRWNRYLRDPYAWVMLLGYIAVGRVISPSEQAA